MSGGQKQRISLARAMYSYCNIVMLDDPFAALDAHVGAHVFKHAILDFLLENKRAVILVTHQLQFLKHADKVSVRSQLAGCFRLLKNHHP